jgi:hypothetical protein
MPNLGDSNAVLEIPLRMARFGSPILSADRQNRERCHAVPVYLLHTLRLDRNKSVHDPKKLAAM